MLYKQTTELYHHGIKGQKWGIRRYQNEDGTLTPEGMARYGVDSRTGRMSREGKKIYKKDQFVDKEIQFQNKKIQEYQKLERENRKSLDEINKNGLNALKDFDMTEDEKKKAVEIVASRRKDDADFYKKLADSLIDYNQKLSDLDITNMKKSQIMSWYNNLGNIKLNEINKYGSDLDKNRKDRERDYV